MFTSVRAPQYASVTYTERETRHVDAIFKALPEFESSWFVDGTDGQNNSFGGVVLTEWDARARTATGIQNYLYGAVAGVLGASVTPFQPAALPASSGGLPFQMVLRTTGGFDALMQDMEKLKATAWRSGLFVFVDSDLAFDNPSAGIVIDTAKAGDLGVTMQAIADTLGVLVGEGY